MIVTVTPPGLKVTTRGAEVLLGPTVITTGTLAPAVRVPWSGETVIELGRVPTVQSTDPPVAFSKTVQLPPAVPTVCAFGVTDRRPGTGAVVVADVAGLLGAVVGGDVLGVGE